MYISTMRRDYPGIQHVHGSNWDVASASSFVMMMDKAIAKFEEEHPGVRIHYYSGISKEDYSEVRQKAFRGKDAGRVYGADIGLDFNLYSSLESWEKPDELQY